MDVDQFIHKLDEDLAWRKKEISDLLLLDASNASDVLMKSLLMMLYAHWEGYIKNAAKLYLLYIAGQNYVISDLSINFHTILLKGLIQECEKSYDGMTLENEMRFLERFSSNQNAIFKLNGSFHRERNKTIVNTQDNLTPKVFANICRIIGMSEKNALVTRTQYFDETFVNGRNAISHGSKVLLDGNNEFDLSKSDISELKELILLIMSHFNDDLQEYATKKYYLQGNQILKIQYDSDSDARLATDISRLSFSRD